MNRAAPQLAIATAAGVFAALAVGSAVLALALLPGAIGLWALAWRSRRGVPIELPWQPPPIEGAFASVGDRPSSGRVVRAIAGVEARELARSPWSGVGFGFCVFMALAFASDYDGNDSWSGVIDDLPFLAHPLAGMMVLAAHRSVTRIRRDDVDELTATCPTSARARTVGLLGTVWVPALAMTAFVGAYLAVVAISGDVHGPAGSASVPVLAIPLVLGAGAVVLGAAIGRWVRSPLAPVVAVVAVGFASLRLAEGHAGELIPRMLLSTMLPLGDPAPAVTSSHAWLQLLWLAAITVATGATAVIGRARDRPVLAAIAGSMAATADRGAPR